METIKNRLKSKILVLSIVLMAGFTVITQGCKINHGKDGFLEIASNDEPGDKLLIHGRVVDQKGNSLSGTKLFIYQADMNGEYRSTLFGMPSFARLRGTVFTDKYGCFTVKTIIPGNYPGEIDGKHIHVVAKTIGNKKWKFEFLFEGWISESLREEIAINQDAIILKPIKKSDMVWTANTKIILKE